MMMKRNSKPINPSHSFSPRPKYINVTNTEFFLNFRIMKNKGIDFESDHNKMV